MNIWMESYHYTCIYVIIYNIRKSENEFPYGLLVWLNVYEHVNINMQLMNDLILLFSREMQINISCMYNARFAAGITSTFK
jgi:hypothetical protein